MTWAAVGIAGGSAVLGGLADVLGGDGGQQERIDAYITNLEKQREEIAKSGRDRKMEIMRMNEAGKKQKLTRANQKAAQAGFDPVSSSYANEEDLDNAMYAGISQSDSETEQALRSIDDKIAAIEAGRPIEESGVSKFIGGAATGANLGLNVANMMTTPKSMGADPTKPAGTMAQTTTGNEGVNNMGKNLAELQKAPETQISYNNIGKDNSGLYGGLGKTGFDMNDPSGVGDMFKETDVTNKPWKNRYRNLIRL